MCQREYGFVLFLTEYENVDWIRNYVDRLFQILSNKQNHILIHLLQ